MGPDAQSEGKYLGFIKGFKLQKQNWLNDFRQSKWNDIKFERVLNKRSFEIAYLEEYERGNFQRQKIEKRLFTQFGEIRNIRVLK